MSDNKVSWDSLSSILHSMKETMSNYKRTGTLPWNARMGIRDLAYQTGGLLKLDMQLHNERHKQGKTETQIREEIEIELAEVLALTLFVADQMNLDVRVGFQKMLDEDAMKIKQRTTLQP